MRRLHKLLLLIATTATLLLTTGCMTESLYDANRAYANPDRELARTDQKLIGAYVGTDYCGDTLSEIYQFESPFTQSDKPMLLEIQIPIYEVTSEQPVRAFETTHARQFEARAELWFWKNHPTPSQEQVAKDTPCRRLDVMWNDRSGRIGLRRYIPDQGVFCVAPKDTDLKVPWRQRSRVSYVARNLGYAVTVPADAAAYGTYYSALAVGYSFLMCPELTIHILCEVL